MRAASFRRAPPVALPKAKLLFIVLAQSRVMSGTSTSSAPASPASPPPCGSHRAARSVVVHEATAFAGGRCRSYHDAVGRHDDRQRQSSAAVRQSRRARLSAQHRRRAPAGQVRRRAEFSFADLASGERWTLRFNDGRIPFWVFDPSRRVPGTGVLDYVPLARLLWAPAGKSVGEVIRCKGTLYERLVEPLLLAALNIDPPRRRRRGSPAAVIRETLALGGRACRPLIARDGWARRLSSRRWRSAPARRQGA